ncbi:MAG: alpha/beta hydrolase [Acidimicrobiia bacterium]|nr:alpha/beta hydrolase [Acidimicrobiia bacterium]MCL4293989.1 alpha/beta hydrolase [Acidimicrobiia bacterium]
MGPDPGPDMMAIARPTAAAREEADEPPASVMPFGRRVPLARRGTTFVRQLDGPPGAPTLLLLHGWAATGGLNWFRVFGPLSSRFSVVAPDLRGHGRGLRSRRPFRLAAVADDCAATILELGTGPVIPVGYSMGGPVAQLLWRRHRDLVAGLVLCATGSCFLTAQRERIVFTSMIAAAMGGTRVGAAAAWVPGLAGRAVARRLPAPGSFPAWSAAEFRRHDWRHVMEAGHAIGTYDSRRWIGSVDVPTAVLVTTRDRAVPPERQFEMAMSIPGATIHRVDGGHTVCATDGLVAPLVEACSAVEERARRAGFAFGNGPSGSRAGAARRVRR